MDKDLLTIKEVMKFSGISRFLLNRLIAENKLVTVKIGRRIFINKESYEQFMKGGNSNK